MRSLTPSASVSLRPSRWPESISRCLMAPSAMRITPRRCASRALSAAFMSVSRRVLRLFMMSRCRDSVESATPRLLARSLLGVTLDGGRALALAFLGGFFVELALSQFRHDAGLLTGPLEAAQRDVELFVVPYSD